MCPVFTVRVAPKDSFWAFASQRVFNVLYDVAAMVHAIEDARSKLPADALIVVRFFSHLGQPMKWPAFFVVRQIEINGPPSHD